MRSGAERSAAGGWLSKALGAFAAGALGVKLVPDTSSVQPTPLVCIDSTVDSKTAWQSTPIVGRRKYQLEQHSAAAHAMRLLQWLREPGGRVGDILASELQEIHVEACAEWGWHARPWNPVARELAARVSGGRKTWAWITDSKGRRFRRRIYRIDSQSTPARVSPCRQPETMRPRLVA